MNETKRDPKLCWLCEKPGVPAIGSQMQCRECEVTWMPYAKVESVPQWEVA